jgi:DNA-binding response OmpR family regulator
MGDFQKILLVDDEELFRVSTCDLLKDKGYICEDSCDATKVSEKLENNEFDLLIADINMPGNAQLELVSKLHASAIDIPIILVTGRPSVKTALESLHLPVVAYLVKPLEIDELIKWVEIGLKKSHTNLEIRKLRNRLKSWDNDMERIQNSMEMASTGHASNELDAFISSAFGNITGSLLDIKRMCESNEQLYKKDATVCHNLNCSRLVAYQAAIKETIDVLVKTKGAFKSRELRDLREKLEKLE